MSDEFHKYRNGTYEVHEDETVVTGEFIVIAGPVGSKMVFEPPLKSDEKPLIFWD